MLLAALGTLMATTVLFVLADSVAWLFVARGLQGLATGLALGAASAALLDLHPRRDPAGVGLTNGVVSAGGMGLGVARLAVAGAARARAARAPVRRAVRPVRDRVRGRAADARAGRGARAASRLTPQRPSIPPVVRRPFLLAALGVISSWSIGGLFLSLGPAAVGATLFHTENHLVAGLGVFALAGPAPPPSSRSAARAPWLGAAARLARAGRRACSLIVLAAATDSSALFWPARVVGGAGFGVAFLGGLRALVGGDPATSTAPR